VILSVYTNLLQGKDFSKNQNPDVEGGYGGTYGHGAPFHVNHIIEKLKKLQNYVF
jgi:hypothetical protein